MAAVRKVELAEVQLAVKERLVEAVIVQQAAAAAEQVLRVRLAAAVMEVILIRLGLLRQLLV